MLFDLAQTSAGILLVTKMYQVKDPKSVYNHIYINI